MTILIQWNQFTPSGTSKTEQEEAIGLGDRPGSTLGRGAPMDIDKSLMVHPTPPLSFWVHLQSCKHTLILLASFPCVTCLFWILTIIKMCRSCARELGQEKSLSKI